MVQIETLPNGVRIVTEPMDTVRSAALGIWVGGGSREEAPSESGAAHFIEHMLFKGTQRRSAQDIARETGCGAEVYLNEGYPAVWNHEALYDAVCAGLGEHAPRLLEAPVLAAEDFSFYQQEVPGVFFFLGVGSTPELHAQDFSFDDEAVLPAGVEFLKRLLTL